jgi:hypothetical protein
MIHAHVEVAKNIKNAVGNNDYRQSENPRDGNLVQKQVNRASEPFRGLPLVLILCKIEWKIKKNR